MSNYMKPAKFDKREAAQLDEVIAEKEKEARGADAYTIGYNKDLEAMEALMFESYTRAAKLSGLARAPAFAGGVTGFGMVKHDPILPYLPVLSLPMTFFSITGSSLGLLLVFRTNVPPEPLP